MTPMATGMPMWPMVAVVVRTVVVAPAVTTAMNAVRFLRVRRLSSFILPPGTDQLVHKLDQRVFLFIRKGGKGGAGPLAANPGVRPRRLLPLFGERDVDSAPVLAVPLPLDKTAPFKLMKQFTQGGGTDLDYIQYVALRYRTLFRQERENPALARMHAARAVMVAAPREEMGGAMKQFKQFFLDAGRGHVDFSFPFIVPMECVRAEPLTMAGIRRVTPRTRLAKIRFDLERPAVTADVHVHFRDTVHSALMIAPMVAVSEHFLEKHHISFIK